MCLHFFKFLSCVCLNFIILCSIFTHSFTQFVSCTWGKCKCWTVCFLCFFGNKQLNSCFEKIRVALIRACWCNLMQANLLIWADSDGWTDWEILTVLAEW